MSFLPSGTKIPKSNGNYLKLDIGETRIRVLESPALAFYEAWKTLSNDSGEETRKPVRALTSKEVHEKGFDKGIDKFGREYKPEFRLAVKVLHYENPKSPSEGGTVKIFQISQMSIMDSINNLTLTEDWKDITSFDVVIKKEGEGKKTAYSVSPIPPKPFGTKEEMAEIAKQAKAIKIEKILTGGDPFAPEEEDKKESSDLPY